MKSTSLKVSKPELNIWRPRPYQKGAMKFLLEHACAGLLLDPGLGKTSIVLGAITELKRAGMFERGLIVAPRRVCYNVWPVEAGYWDQFKSLKVSIVHGDERKRDRALEADADLYVINPEGLAWFFADKARAKALCADTLVVDESTKFKNSQSQRFKALRPFLRTFDRRWILTGSIMPNGYMDLFGQMYVCDEGACLGQYLTHYRNNYFFPSGFGGYDWKLKEGSEKIIQERIKPYVLRLETKGRVTMPERFDSVVRVTLDEKTRKRYDEMEEEMITTLDGGKTSIEALTAAAASNKCAQIANGGLYFDQWEKSGEAMLLKRGYSDVHTEKLDAVEDRIEESTGMPCVVAYDYLHDRDRLVKRLGKDTPVIGGGVSDTRCSMIIEAWNRREIPVLLAQPGAMGHGLNMQLGGNRIIFHSIPWDYEVYDQFIRRFWRSGAAYDKVFVDHVVATATVDEAKVAALKGKATKQNTFMDALRTYANARRSNLKMSTK